jgi:hypothetical protein
MPQDPFLATANQGRKKAPTPPAFTPAPAPLSYQAQGWYDPTSAYGGDQGATGYVNAPVGNMYLQNQPLAAYTRFLGGIGGLGDDAFSRWAQQQYQRAHQGFLAALATNPNLNFYRDYLPQTGGMGEWQQRFGQLDPRSRGENPSLYTGPARWIQRQ